MVHLDQLHNFFLLWDTMMKNVATWKRVSLSVDRNKLSVHVVNICSNKLRHFWHPLLDNSLWQRRCTENGKASQITRWWKRKFLHTQYVTFHRGAQHNFSLCFVPQRLHSLFLDATYILFMITALDLKRKEFKFTQHLHDSSCINCFSFFLLWSLYYCLLLNIKYNLMLFFSSLLSKSGQKAHHAYPNSLELS